MNDATWIASWVDRVVTLESFPTGDAPSRDTNPAIVRLCQRVGDHQTPVGRRRHRMFPPSQKAARKCARACRVCYIASYCQLSSNSGFTGLFSDGNVPIDERITLPSLIHLSFPGIHLN